MNDIQATRLLGGRRTGRRLFAVGQWLVAAAMGCLTAACGEDTTSGPGTTPASEQVAVNFDTSLTTSSDTRGGQAGTHNGQAGTRGGQTGTISGLGNPDLGLLGTIGVFAYLTDKQLWATAKGSLAPNAATYPSPEFMYNQPVSWAYEWKNGEGTHERWTYTPPKYWPNYDYNDPAKARYVSFFAYAPYTEDFSGTGIVGIPDASDKSPHINYTMGSDVKSMVDLLWAARPDGTRNGQGLVYFAGTEERWQTVPLHFQHALSCVDIYVERNYDDLEPQADVPHEADDTRIFVSAFALEPQTDTKLATGGRLSLEDGSWTDIATSSERTITFDNTALADWLSGSAKATASEATVADIRVNELDKWDWLWTDDVVHDQEKGTHISGVLSEQRLLHQKTISLMLLPQKLTLRPKVSYSFVTRDDALEFGYLLDSDGAAGKNSHRYSRIFHQDLQGNPITVQLLAGKRYKLVCRIGVEHVSLEVASVEDWDFPLRFTTNVDDTDKESRPVTVTED